MKKYILLQLCCIIGLLTCYGQDNIVNTFLPKGYIIVATSYGDLNNDGEEDCILVVKGTDKNKFVINRFDEKVDRNRRGVIILFKDEDVYKLAAENYDCFLSENEDGGVYYPPELWLGVESGNLVIQYGHGRYGYWRYLFRYQESKFKLIGYDSSSNRGPIVQKETNINFLTKRKLVRENINENDEGGDEVFKETWHTIHIEKLWSLSDIKDFEDYDAFNMAAY